MQPWYIYLKCYNKCYILFILQNLHYIYFIILFCALLSFYIRERITILAIVVCSHIQKDANSSVGLHYVSV